MQKAIYIIEKSCDKHKTLCQAIEINLYLDEQSNGLHSKYLKSTINPNLSILYERLWLDENGKVLKRELFEED